MRMRSLIALGIALALFLPACSTKREPIRAGTDAPADGQGLGGAAFDPPLPAPDFTLTDPQGAPYRLSDQKGKAVLLFFGYTSCPDVCPTTLAEMRRVRSLLGDGADRLQVVFVTVDPERDLPERLGQYVRTAGHESFLGLTGARADLERVWKDYGVYVERAEAPGSAIGYTVSHSAFTYLVGPDGNLLTAYPFGTKPEDIAADLKRLFKATAQNKQEADR